MSVWFWVGVCYLVLGLWFLGIVAFLRGRWKGGRAEHLALSLTLATVAIVVVYFVLRITYCPRWIVVGMLGLLTVISAASAFRKRRALLEVFAGRFLRQCLPFVLAALTFFLIAGFYIGQNGYDDSGNLRLVDIVAKEVMHHLALVTQINVQSWPVTMDVTQYDRSEYHFFANYFISAFSYSLPALDKVYAYVYFFTPVFLLLLGVNSAAFCVALWRDMRVAFWTVLVVWLVYDVSSLFVWMNSYKMRAWSIWYPVITFFQQYNNPSYLTSIALLPAVFLSTWQMQRNRSAFVFAVTLILWLVLLKAKITTFLPAFAGLLWVAGVDMWRRRQVVTMTLAGLVTLFFGILQLTGSYGHHEVQFSNGFFVAEFAQKFGLLSAAAIQELRQRGVITDAMQMTKFVILFPLWHAGLLGFRALAFLRTDWRFILGMLFSDSPHRLSLVSILAGLGAFVLIVNQLVVFDSMWFYLGLMPILSAYAVRRWRQLSGRRWVLAGGALLMISSMLTFAVPVLRKSVRRGSYTYSADHMQALGAARTYESTGRFLFHTDSTMPNILNGVYSEKRLVAEQSTYYEPLLSGDQIRVLKEAREDADYFFATQDSAGAAAILKKYDVSLVMETADAPLHFSPLSTWSMRYAGPTVRLYEIRP